MVVMEGWAAVAVAMEVEEGEGERDGGREYARPGDAPADAFRKKASQDCRKKCTTVLFMEWYSNVMHGLG